MSTHATAGCLRALRLDATRTPQWLGTNPWQAVERLRREVIQAGVCLPPTRMADGDVVPIVMWDGEAMAYRQAHALSPVLDRARLHELVDRGQLPPDPVVVVGFVSVAPLSTSGRVLSRLSAYGRTVALVPPGSEPSPIEAAAFDLRGIAIAVAQDHAVEVLVPGNPGPKPGALRGGVQVRLRHEQLFDLALRAGVVDL